MTNIFHSRFANTMVSCLTTIACCMATLTSPTLLVAADGLANSSSGIHFEEGMYDLFAEPSLKSPYIFIPPKGLYNLTRTVKNDKSILEGCYDNTNIYKRYRVDTGFFLLRKESSYSNQRCTKEKIENEIDDFYNSEITEHKVFFYDQKYLLINKNSAYCEGKIFSPLLNSTGVFFLKRENPIYIDDYEYGVYYMLFYSFELDYDLAKAEFEKIVSYIHCVRNGSVK